MRDLLYLIDRHFVRPRRKATWLEMISRASIKDVRRESEMSYAVSIDFLSLFWMTIYFSPRTPYGSIYFAKSMKLPRVVVIRSFVLDALPDLIDALTGLVTQRTIGQALERLLELLLGAGADDDGVPVALLEGRVVRHPTVGQLGARAAFLVGDDLPLGQGVEERLLHVHVPVHAAQGLLAEPTGAVLDLLGRLGQEPTGHGRVGVERHVELAERGEQFRLLESSDGAVVALVGRREHVAVLLARVVDPLHVLGRVVGQAETLKQAEFVGFVDPGHRLFDRTVLVRSVDVKDVDL